MLSQLYPFRNKILIKIPVCNECNVNLIKIKLNVIESVIIAIHLRRPWRQLITYLTILRRKTVPFVGKTNLYSL